MYWDATKRLQLTERAESTLREDLERERASRKARNEASRGTGALLVAAAIGAIGSSADLKPASADPQEDDVGQEEPIERRS